jgi:hypothetical protein
VNKMIDDSREARSADIGHCRALVLLSALLLLLLVSSQVVLGQEPNRAALVVRFSDERTESVCISFSEETITGYDLLQRSGLAVATDNSGAGVTVCRLDDTGCAPGNCFCECQGDPCVYWSYWQRRDGTWQYALAGAAANEVVDGAVEGWSWGPGSVTEAIAPPDVSFEDVCAATVQEAPPPGEVPLAAANDNVATTPMVNPGAGQAVDGDNGAPVWSYGVFVFLLMALAAFFIWTRGKRDA